MKKEIRHAIGKKIKALRQKKGLTQSELSEISKVAYKYLQEIEGKNPPNLRVDTLARIAKALKINASGLLDS